MLWTPSTVLSDPPSDNRGMLTAGGPSSEPLPSLNPHPTHSLSVYPYLHTFLHPVPQPSPYCWALPSVKSRPDLLLRVFT
jgi:hypothetical protein